MHELYERHLRYLLHSDDLPQAKLEQCRRWLNNLSQHPSLAAAIYPTFAACRDALQAVVAARPKRRGTFEYRKTGILLSPEYQRIVEERLAAKERRQ